MFLISGGSAQSKGNVTTLEVFSLGQEAEQCQLVPAPGLRWGHSGDGGTICGGGVMGATK